MKRFIELSSVCRLVGWRHGKSKTVVRAWVCAAIAIDQEVKREAAAGGIGLS